MAIRISSPIEIQTAKVAFHASGQSWEVIICLIPKRGRCEPIQCRKTGAYEGKEILAVNATYFRDSDNTCTANTNLHWKLLYGPRINPCLAIENDLGPIRFVENNLPDKSFICSEFIGRRNVLQELYEWFSDDFTCVRVLAGEGGLGKTSTAFEFAYDVAREHLGNPDIVLWFTAKKLQFRPMQNSYEELASASFSNSTELFSVIAEGLGATMTEIEEVSVDKLPKFLHSLLKEVCAFVVVDDLDTLDINEQKRCIEVCQQLAGTGSRFLFTTRKNATASSSTAIEIRGLKIDEYEQLIKIWEGRLNLQAIPFKIVEKLHDVSSGSPLYTESLLRLIKSGIPANDAISKWKGNLGVEVRNAALKREVTQLGAESKKVLVASAVFGECSFAEIKLATNFSDITLTDCVSELQSLFLISAPAIADQPRFKISNTTRELVLALGPELIPTFGSYCEKIRKERYTPKNKKIDSQRVGAAINQSMALITSGNPEVALNTINEVISEVGESHPDLLFMRARVLSHLGASRSKECRNAYKSAHEHGQRKLKFFTLWYEFEISTKHFETAIEVCSNAIDASAGEKADWLFNRAHSRVRSAAEQLKVDDWEHVRAQLTSASNDLSLAKRSNHELAWDATWAELFYSTHDTLWQLDRKDTTSIPNLIIALDNQTTAIDRGDLRPDLFIRIVSALADIEVAALSSGKEMSSRSFNLLQKATRDCKNSFSKASSLTKTMRSFVNAQSTLNHFAKSYKTD